MVCSFHPPTLIPQSAGNLVGGWFAASTLPPSYCSVQAIWLVVGLQLPTSHPGTLILESAGNLVGGWFAASTLPPSYSSVQATWLVVGLQLPPSHPPTRILQCTGNLVSGWSAASTLPPSYPHTGVCRQPGWCLVCSFHPPTLQPSYCSAQAT